MLFSYWLRNWKASAPAARGRTPTSPRPRASFRPRLEALEDRCLPSGLPYPTAATVSQLIADINYADTTGGAFTINLKPSTTFDLKSVNNTTDGANGLPVIGGTKAVDLSITGNGDTIDRVGVLTFKKRSVSNASFRLFDVAQDASLTLDHVRLQGGLASGSYSVSAGGAVYNRGTLKVIDGSTLSGNSAGSGSDIYNAGGMVTVSYSTAGSSTGSTAGSIYNSGGTVTLSYSTASGIYNSGGTVTVSYSSLSSGRISNASGTMTVSNSTVSGGGINNEGTLTVSNSTLSNNSAYYGGGIYNSGGTVTVSNSTLSGNGAGYFGGGIYTSGGTVTVSSSILSGNTAGSGGRIYNAGGAVTVSNSILSGNSATNGGGIYNAGGTVTVSNNSTLSGNYAMPDYGNRFGYGGGIYNSGGTVTISNSILSGNFAQQGGGIYNDPAGTVTVQNSSRIIGNDDSVIGIDPDVYNLGVLYLDSTSTIGILDGNPAILI